eukprot:COSAG02_NODE_51846_length_311_cov_1.183962_1_plen_53_part_00
MWEPTNVPIPFYTRPAKADTAAGRVATFLRNKGAELFTAKGDVDKTGRILSG